MGMMIMMILGMNRTNAESDDILQIGFLLTHSGVASGGSLGNCSVLGSEVN